MVIASCGKTDIYIYIHSSVEQDMESVILIWDVGLDGLGWSAGVGRDRERKRRRRAVEADRGAGVETIREKHFRV